MVHGNSLPKESIEISMYPVTLRLIQKCFIPTYKWSMEISTYLVNINFETISEILYRKVHGDFHVSCNIETNIIQKCFTKGSMEISMYPVILRLIQKFFTKRSMEISMYCTL